MLAAMAMAVALLAGVDSAGTRDACVERRSAARLPTAAGSQLSSARSSAAHSSSVGLHSSMASRAACSSGRSVTHQQLRVVLARKAPLTGATAYTHFPSPPRSSHAHSVGSDERALCDKNRPNCAR